MHEVLIVGSHREHRDVVEFQTDRFIHFPFLREVLRSLFPEFFSSRIIA